MCYSARVWSDYRKFVREFGADVSVKEFYDLYWHRANGTKVSVQGGMDASFKDAQGADERRIEKLVEPHHAGVRADLSAELTKQLQRFEATDLALSRRRTFRKPFPPLIKQNGTAARRHVGLLKNGHQLNNVERTSNL